MSGLALAEREATETADATPVRPGPERSPSDGLVAAAAAGDERARERLIAEIYPFVVRYCRGKLGRGNPAVGSADDVAQEVCLAVAKALPRYVVGAAPFRAFVYGIASHKVTDAFRAGGRDHSDPMADLPDVPAPHDDPEQHVLDAERLRAVRDLLHLLSKHQREVLVLRLIVGLSAEETAQAVGSTSGGVRVTQHRALNRLRDHVNRGGVAPPAAAGR